MNTVKPEGYEKMIETESEKIEDARKRRAFFNSGLSGLIMGLANEYGLNLYDTDIYSTFIQTGDFNAFLLALGFTQKDIDSICTTCYYSDIFLDAKYSPDLGTLD